jgi:hypothetical protein
MCAASRSWHGPETGPAQAAIARIIPPKGKELSAFGPLKDFATAVQKGRLPRYRLNCNNRFNRILICLST